MGKNIEDWGLKQLQPSALRGPLAQAFGPAKPETHCGGDLSLLSPAPLLSPPWLYKQSLLNQGPSCCPDTADPRAHVSGTHRGQGQGGRAHLGIEMAPRGLGIQCEYSQQGPPGLGRRQVPGINIYFLTSWCLEEKPSWAVKPHLALT